MPTVPADSLSSLIEEKRNAVRSTEQLGRPSRSIHSTDRRLSSSPHRPPPEIWMPPAISPAEDALPAETYNPRRRGSTASMRSTGSVKSTGSGASIRPSITKTIPARTDERPYESSATEGSDYERTGQGRAWRSGTHIPRVKEKRPHIRRNSPSPVDTTALRSDEPLGRLGLRSASSSAMQSITSPISRRSLSAKPSLTLVDDNRHYPSDHGKPYHEYRDQTSPRDSYPHRDQPSARPIPEKSSYSEDDRDYVSPYSTFRRPRGPKSSSYHPQRVPQPISRQTSFTRQLYVDIDSDDDDRGMDQGRDQERLQDRDYDEETDRDRGKDGSRPVPQIYTHMDKLYDDRTEGAGQSPGKGRNSYQRTNRLSASTSAGKPRTSSVSYGTYPMRSSPLAESQQEQFRHTQENLEAERQLTSVSLSQKQSQRIFEHHERLWNRLNTLSELSWTDFPWPVAKPPSHPDDISLPLIDAYILSPVYPDKDKSITIQDRIMEHIRRWGPVRFETKFLPKVVKDEREKVKHAARNVATYLCDLLKKENESHNNMNDKKDMEMKGREDILRWREGLMRQEEVKRAMEARKGEEVKRKNRCATIFRGRETEPSYRGGNSTFFDEYESDDNSTEDEAETKRLRNTEAKMQTPEEDKRAAENELDRIKVELQRLIDKAAKEDEEARRREEEVAKKEQDAEKREEAVKRREEEVMQKAAQIEEDKERTKRMQLEAQKTAEDTLKKQDDLKKMEDLVRREVAVREEAGMVGNNMLVTGGAFNIAEGDIHINGSGKSLADKGIAKLFLKVASGAFHDSGELSDPLMVECHPNSRIDAIQQILDWLDDPKSPELVMWLNGATGAGKSAIAQTIAQVLSERGELSGSFFFARGSTTGRGDERRLVPTLAYQLAKYLPDTRFHIAMTVVSDPAIFDLALRRQVQDLLINPLRSVTNAVSSPSPTTPRLYIIDGLDECRSANVQCVILQIFAAAVKSLQHHLPHKLLITSRSEMHLLAGFNNTATTYRQLSLDNSYLSG